LSKPPPTVNLPAGKCNRPITQLWQATPEIAGLQLRDGAVVMQFLKLSPEWTKLVVSARLRLSDYQKGPEGWHGARVALRFLDDNNTMVGGYPSHPRSQATPIG
jgi:hypothetical protein